MTRATNERARNTLNLTQEGERESERKEGGVEIRRNKERLIHGPDERERKRRKREFGGNGDVAGGGGGGEGGKERGKRRKVLKVKVLKNEGMRRR